MTGDLDSLLTASLLESGSALAQASHVAAVIAGFGGVASHSAAARLVFSSSILCWLAGCWFAVRVAIDAKLFRRLASEPEDAWQRLDELRSDWGFLKPRVGRSVVGRRRAAITLWRRQLISLAMQFAILITAMALQNSRLLCLPR
jgi:hypothetical protein